MLALKPNQVLQHARIDNCCAWNFKNLAVIEGREYLAGVRYPLQSAQGCERSTVALACLRTLPLLYKFEYPHQHCVVWPEPTQEPCCMLVTHCVGTGCMALEALRQCVRERELISDEDGP
jgi:hypothetical protein